MKANHDPAAEQFVTTDLSTARESARLDTAAHAYALARDQLGLRDHIDPLNKVLAHKVLDATHTAVDDPEHLATLAVEALGTMFPSSDQLEQPFPPVATASRLQAPSSGSL